jgi:tRNA G18 (ribose-2'-O)-methylase SpoU
LASHFGFTHATVLDTHIFASIRGLGRKVAEYCDFGRLDPSSDTMCVTAARLVCQRVRTPRQSCVHALRANALRANAFIATRRMSYAARDMEHVSGWHAVNAVVQSGSRPVSTLYLASTAPSGTDAAALVARLPPTVPVVRVDAATLGNLGRDSGGNHQGVVAAVPPLRVPTVVDVAGWARSLNARSPLLLALDELSDPHNLGACLRSAWLLGVDGVVMSQRNCAPLSATTCRASAGALEYMAAGPSPRIAVVRNMAAALQALQQDPTATAPPAQAPWWDVVAAAAAAPAAATPGATSSTTATRVRVPSQLGRREGVGQVIVLGSEGRGVRPLVAAACRGGIVSIPHAPSRAGSAVDSLNVSVAAGLLIYHAAQAAS